MAADQVAMLTAELPELLRGCRGRAVLLALGRECYRDTTDQPSQARDGAELELELRALPPEQQAWWALAMLNGAWRAAVRGLAAADDDWLARTRA